MRTTLIKGLSEKDIQTVINNYNLRDYYFPSLFPLRFTPTLSWKALQANIGAPVAADVVAYNASAPRKTRRVIERAQGEIPKIEIAREKSESDLNEYFQLTHYASTTEGGIALRDFIFEDTQFCWDGINARIEWLAMQALSTGKVSLSKTNNAGIITETAVDFLLPASHKKVVSAANRKWNAVDTAKPITDIKDITKEARKEGIRLRYAFMNQETFDQLAATKEAIDFCANWVLRATSQTRRPSIDDVNAALVNENLPEIRIIDSLVTIELADGTQTGVDPWAEGMVTFVTSPIVGATYHAPLADEIVEASAAIKAKRGHVLIKKFSTEDPVVEVTKGLANAFPVWSTSNQSWVLNTLQTTWQH